MTSWRDPSRLEKLPRPTAVRNPNPASCSILLRFLGHNSIGLGSRFSTASISASASASNMPNHGPPDNVRRFHSSEGGCSSSSRISKPAVSAPLGRGKFFQSQPNIHTVSNIVASGLKENLVFQLQGYISVIILLSGSSSHYNQHPS
jgi:hypothetical protein